MAGYNLVTSIDAGVQGAAEKALKHAIDGARKAGRPADAGAAVVMDVQTGKMIAMASFPTYDPSIWTGGISQEEYDALLGKKKGEPLISRVTQGQFAPGSTFKISSVSAAVKDGNSLNGIYPCQAPTTSATARSATSRASRSARCRCTRRSSSPATRSSTASRTRSGSATAG